MNDEANHPDDHGLNSRPTSQSSGQSGAEDNLAVEMIRGKIKAIFGGESNTGDKQPEPAPKRTAKSKHQEFMDELSGSGRSLADIQTKWHEYYTGLPDAEKYEVWQEFYAEHSRLDEESNKAKVHPPRQSAPIQAKKEKHTPLAAKSRPARKRPKDSRSVSEIKHQITRRARSRAKPRRSTHVQSIIFGLSMGAIVVIVMLFGFFNERIIAPFITPSRTVSSTPIITDLNSSAVGKESKIIIPKINVEIPVVYDEPSIQEEAVQKALERGVLHYPTTPNPGEKGNAVIFGHSSNNILNSGKYKFAFVLLSRLEENDTFMLEKGGKRYVYKVFEKKVVAPTDLSVLANHGDKSTVALITCDPPGTSINRLVVTAEQISPSPAQNIASSVKSIPSEALPKQLPSNSPSLWSRFVEWF